jgi:hypothetical protein
MTKVGMATINEKTEQPNILAVDDDGQNHFCSKRRMNRG